MDSARAPLSAARAVACAGIAVLFGLAVLSAGPGNPQDPAGGRERQVFVTAVTGDGTPVTDLTAAEFTVREDGVRREVLRIQKAESPFTIALLVDNSAVSDPYIADYRAALHGFLKRMAGEHTIALTTFGDRPTIAVDYTLDRASLTRGVDRLFPAPESGAYFLDAIRELSKGFAKRDFERAAIVAIAADGPEFSDRHYSNVLPDLQASGAALHVIVLRSGRTMDLRDEGYKNRAILIDEGAKTTGGSRVELLNSLALGNALNRLADQLLNQYRVTYARPDALIPPQKVEVGVTRAGLTARATPMKTPRG